jgi:uncharacterized protein (TIGR02444 family)
MAASAAGNLDNAFWKFSLAVYAAPGVGDECMAVQERCGVDVNMLLFCAWLASARKVALTPADIEAIGTLVGGWHESAVRPLRGVRRYMKNVPGGDVAALRTRAKAAELEAEQIEQAMLFAYAEQHWPRHGQAALPAAFWSNLETYLGAQGYSGPGGEALPFSHLCAAVKALPAAS